MEDIIFRLYCEMCGYNRWTDGTDIGDLLVYQRSPIQTAMPKYDPKQKKTVQKEFHNLPKQFKCPKCGRLITAKKYPKPKDAKADQNEEADNVRNQDGNAGL